MPDPFKVGILGLGVGEQHLMTYLSHSKVREVVAYDPDPAVIMRVQKNNPKAIYAKTANEVIDDP